MMNRYINLFLLLLLLLISCSDSNYSGGATDIGNGYVAGSINTKSSQVLISLATHDYYKNNNRGDIYYTKAGSDNSFSFENIESGEYVMWAGDELSNQLLINKININEDTLIFTDLELRPLGGITFTNDYFAHNSIPTGLYVAGSNIVGTIERDSSGKLYVDSLPAGTFDILFFQDDELKKSDVITVISETVIEISETYELVQLPYDSKSASTKVLKDYQDTLWCGTDNGLGFYCDGVWDFQSKALHELSETVINDISFFHDTLFLATNKGVLKRGDNFWIETSLKDSILEFEQNGDTLYILSPNTVCQYSDTTFKSLAIDTFWNPQNSLTTFTVSVSGDIWVGTDKNGVYRHSSSGWTRESDQLNWETVTHNCFSTDRSGVLWLATEGEGLYYFQNDFWARAPMDSYEGKIQEVSHIGESSMIAVAHNGTIIHNIGTMTELTTLTFHTSDSVQIENIYVDDNDRVYISSTGQGVYYLELN